MIVDTDTMIPITGAGQDFSKVTRSVDEHDTAVISKDDMPKYLVIYLSKTGKGREASMDDVLAVSQRLIEQNMEAYEILAE